MIQVFYKILKELHDLVVIHVAFVVTLLAQCVYICKNHIDKETTHQMNYKDEWIKGDNKFVHFKTLLKIGSVAKIYLMCGLLQNARTKDPVTVKE